ncbi:MAG: hypothetical protein ACLTYN_05700 [Dysosmobacter welbionis]
MLRGATALGCAKTRQFCCFIGPEDGGENLRDLAVLAEKEHQQQEDGEEAFVDNVIMYEILSELKDIAARRMGSPAPAQRTVDGDPPQRRGSHLPGLRGQASDRRHDRTWTISAAT